MSDHDIDDELLFLAGVKEKKRSKPKSSSSRKRKSPVDSDSERDVESEENDESDGDTNPFPYEGKYIDEEDKQRLLEMPEIKREEIITERIERMQRLQERQVLAQMVKAQRSGGGGGGTFDADEDSVAKAAKRQHTARGATKEKTRKLDELKAKRKAKDESRKRARLSPNDNRRSSSPQDMDISSDEDSEDGQITKSDQEEERERRLLGIKKQPSEEDSAATVADFNRCRLTRDMVAKMCMAPWFDKYVQDAWVRYLIGNNNGEPVYRMCSIKGISSESTKPYKVNERTVNQMVDLQHGKSVKAFNMDKISNAPFTPNEFVRLDNTCTREKVQLPTKKELLAKAEEMQKLESQPMTDSDITAMLKKKKEMSASKSAADLVLEKQRLHQTRSLALKRQDYKEAAELEQKIAELEMQIHGGSLPKKSVDDKDEILRKVNERNRKANLDAVRRAEIAESERKRKEREAAAKAAALGGPVAAAAIISKHDPSARVKTMPRLFNAATPATRPGTPASQTGTPAPPSGLAKGSDASIRPVPSANTTMAFEKKLLDTIDIDLGDF